MCGKSNDMWSKMRILKINLRESMNVKYNFRRDFNQK